MAAGNGADLDPGVVMSVLARMEAKIDRLNERVDVLEAVDMAAKSEGAHARTLATAQLDALRGEVDALAQRVELVERSRP